MTKPLEKPQPPADGECCDSACTPCVWDHYYADLKKWRLQQVELKAIAEQNTQVITNQNS